MRKILLLCVAAVSSMPLQAWNSTGHMTVAYVSYRRLGGNPKLKARALAILEQHLDYERWVDGIPKTPEYADLRGLTAFLRASVWPDEIKSDPRFQNGGADTSVPDMFRHQNWHYIDEPLIGPFDALKVDEGDHSFRKAPTVLTQIRVCRAAIANTTLTGATRAYYLAWLLHLVGDIHQPLHAVARQLDGKGDNGGNLVKLDGAEGNLHSYWDGALGSETSLGAISTLGDGLIRNVLEDPREGLDEEAWFHESVALAIQFVYGGLAGAASTDRGLVLTPRYHSVAVNVAEARVVQAGYRLAGVIAAALY